MAQTFQYHTPFQKYGERVLTSDSRRTAPSASLQTQCGVSFLFLDSRRVLAPTPKVLVRCWDQNTSQIQILRHFRKKRGAMLSFKIDWPWHPRVCVLLLRASAARASAVRASASAVQVQCVQVQVRARAVRASAVRGCKCVGGGILSCAIDSVRPSSLRWWPCGCHPCSAVPLFSSVDAVCSPMHAHTPHAHTQHTIAFRLKYLSMDRNYERLFDFSGDGCGKDHYFVDAYDTGRMTYQTYGCGHGSAIGCVPDVRLL